MSVEANKNCGFRFSISLRKHEDNYAFYLVWKNQYQEIFNSGVDFIGNDYFDALSLLFTINTIEGIYGDMILQFGDSEL